MFREWLAWNAPDGGPDQHDNTMQALIELGDVLIRRGLARFDDGAITPAGAALLARVEAAERTPAAVLPGICQGQMRAYRCALPVGHTGLHADEGRFTLWPDAADTRPVVTLPGTAPIDAPPAKEPK
jgi:hypothetical protein